MFYSKGSHLSHMRVTHLHIAIQDQVTEGCTFECPLNYTLYSFRNQFRWMDSMVDFFTLPLCEKMTTCKLCATLLYIFFSILSQSNAAVSLSMKKKHFAYLDQLLIAIHDVYFLFHPLSHKIQNGHWPEQKVAMISFLEQLAKWYWYVFRVKEFNYVGY